jgi:hypothetical protein
VRLPALAAALGATFAALALTRENAFVPASVAARNWAPTKACI